MLVLNAAAMRKCRRELDAVASVATAAVAYQKQSCQTWCLHMRSTKPKWVYVGRSHDATPIRLSFGLLQELAPHARYWNRASKHSKAALLTYEELQRAGVHLPAQGILELLAQTGRLAWPQKVGDDYICHVQHLDFPVLFLARNNSSTLFAALDSVDDSLKLDSLMKLTDTVDFVVLFLGLH
jgi:hypothetical protein